MWRGNRWPRDTLAMAKLAGNWRSNRLGDKHADSWRSIRGRRFAIHIPCNLRSFGDRQLGKWVRRDGKYNYRLSRQPMSIVFYLDFACLVISCLLSNLISSFIYKRIRGSHPQIWQGLRFPKGTAYPGARHEREQARSQLRLLSFVWSDRRKALNDRQLDRLVVGFSINGAMALLFLLLGAVLILHNKLQ